MNPNSLKSFNSAKSGSWAAIEPLESRIAPAAVAGPLLNESKFFSAVDQSALLLHAGEGISTGGPGSGAYLVYVLKGTAKVFTTDFNNNKQVDFNEITGIAAGDGLQMLVFCDIHGDIVTNLNSNGLLTDSDNNPANGRDGRVLLNSRIEMIQMRSLQDSDIDLTLLNNTVASHHVTASHSIYGGIYAGGGFGLADGSGGLFFGNDSQAETPSVGPIMVGTAASGQHFSFGVFYGGPVAPTTGPDGTNVYANKAGEVQGVLQSFSPLPGQAGAEINGIHAIDGQSAFNISILKAGDGGFGAPGGNVSNVTITGETSGGYKVYAGNGGRGLVGGAGGSITNFSDLGSVTSNVLFKSGNGGQGMTGAGGAGGTISFGTMSLAAAVDITTGSGGNGFTDGGNGASFVTGIFSTPENISIPDGLNVVGSTRNLDPILLSVTDSLHLANEPIGDNPHPVAGMPANFWPSIPSIGQNQAVDFNHDGFGDVVLTTGSADLSTGNKVPSQVIVLFGDGAGGYDYSKTLFLDAPENPGAVVVGDFNNDGHPDIAVASSSASYSGVSVFLSQFADVAGNGAPSKFTGFTTALQSTLPVMAVPLGSSGDLPPDTMLPMKTRVLAMTMGDYNGDQINDLAVQVQYYEPAHKAWVTRVLFMDGDVDERGFGNGYFFGNFGQEKFASISPFYGSYFTQNPNAELKSMESGPMKSSAFSSLGDIYNYSIPRHDRVYVGSLDAKGLVGLDNSVPSAWGPLITKIGLGNVDTSRITLAEDGKTPIYDLTISNNNAGTEATLQDFALLDINGDGVTDLVALTKTPDSFLVVFEGQAASQTFLCVSSPNGMQNAGISLNEQYANPTQPPGYAYSGDLKGVAGVSILASPDDNGDFNRLMLLIPGNQSGAKEIIFTHVDQLPSGVSTPVIHSVVGGATLASDWHPALANNWGVTPFTLVSSLILPIQPDAGSGLPPVQTKFSAGWLTVDHLASDYTQAGYGENDDGSLSTGYYGQGDTGYFDYHFVFQTGNGGNGVIGSGGSGGVIGAGRLSLPSASSLSANGTSSSNADLTITYDYPTNLWIWPGPTKEGMGATLYAGDGGSGFKAGGNGGSISGVSLDSRYYYSASAHAGSGGNGFQGAGGNGGDIWAFHLNPVTEITAGNGGDGNVGGRGGNVIGNGFAVSSGYYDATTYENLAITAGHGGHGIKRGGSGGSVTDLTPYFEPYLWANGVFRNMDGRAYFIQAGDGGSAVSGAGGSGGSVLNCSLVGPHNYLSGDINIIAGIGGDGLTGGSGGSIVNFINKPTNPSILPGALSLVAGNGGSGISGSGGTGGGVSTISFAAYGVGKSWTDIGGLLGAKFNRVVAGDGGNSSGGAGGSGGSLTSINVSAQSGAMLAIAGSGGTGVASGGTGGSVVDSLVNSSGNLGANDPIGKVVVIAGAGGDALASLPFNHLNPNSPATNEDAIKSFGGVNGRGGNGGSILNFQQPLSIHTNVDLIAGNGGSTINYGTAMDSSGGAGVGGSISGAQVLGVDGSVQANIYGNIGNSEPHVAIKAYNNTLGDYRADVTMRQFVQETFRTQSQIYNVVVNDSLGNVGLVAGAAGRVMNDQGASYGVNGSVSNLTMNSGASILSMVAGSVDRIAKIQSISGVGLASGGSLPGSSLGADKDVVPVGSPTMPTQPALGGQLDYYNDLGLVVHTLPQPGFGLIDGVIFASKITGMTTGSTRVVQA